VDAEIPGEYPVASYAFCRGINRHPPRDGFFIGYGEIRNLDKWSREKAIQEIKHLYSNGHSLRPKDFRKEGMVKLVSAATYHFGSWLKAVETCGVCYSCGREKRPVDKFKDK